MEKKGEQKSVSASAPRNDRHETNLELAPLSILPNEVRLKECLILVRENTSGFLEYFP